MENAPYYQQMASLLIEKIKVGTYSIGFPLPTERELCESFGVSRHTTREALKQLETKGLIKRRQGSGSTVIARTPPVRYEQSIQSIDDLMQQGSASRLQVLNSQEVEAGTNQFVSQIALLAKKRCIRIQSIRYLRNEVRPLAVVDVYIAVQSKAQAKRLLSLETAAREVVATTDPSQLDRIEQAFNAVNLEELPAALLHVNPGDAAFQTIRSYFDANDRLIAIAHSLYCASLFTYTSTLRRQ